MNNAVVVSGKKFERAKTTNYVESSLQPEGDVPDAPAEGVVDSTGLFLCVLQDEELIPVNVVSIEGDKVYFHIQFIDEYNGKLSESEELYVGTIIEGEPPVAHLEDKYSTYFYISAD